MIQFSFTIHLYLKSDPHKLKGSFLQVYSTLEASHKSQASLSLTDQLLYKLSVLINPSLGLTTCWNDSQNSRKHFTYYYWFTTEVTSQHGQMAQTPRIRRGEKFIGLPCFLRAHHPPLAPSCAYLPRSSLNPAV